MVQLSNCNGTCHLEATYGCLGIPFTDLQDQTPCWNLIFFTQLRHLSFADVWHALQHTWLKVSSVPRLGSRAKPLQTSTLLSNAVLSSHDGRGCYHEITGCRCLILRALSFGWTGGGREGWSTLSDPETRISMVQPLQLSVSSHVTVTRVHSWLIVDLLGLFRKADWMEENKSFCLVLLKASRLISNQVLYDLRPILTSRNQMMFIFTLQITLCISNMRKQTLDQFLSFFVYVFLFIIKCFFFFFFFAAFSAGSDRLQSLHFVQSWK